MGIKHIFTANIIVAGWVGISSLFFPMKAASIVFTDAYSYSDSIRILVHCGLE